jgi:hypothetical protein
MSDVGEEERVERFRSLHARVGTAPVFQKRRERVTDRSKCIERNAPLSERSHWRVARERVARAALERQVKKSPPLTKLYCGKYSVKGMCVNTISA